MASTPSTSTGSYVLTGNEATSGRVLVPITTTSPPSTATSGITIMSYNMLAQHLIRRDKHYP
jgi:mRNA deadenylase 3'-5' endonuclease subunit Ccr4